MVTLLLDDERTFADKRECLVATSTEEAIELTKDMTELDELWLDYVLKRSDTTDNFLMHLVSRKRDDNALELHKVYIHTSSSSAVSLLQAYLEDLEISDDRIEIVNHEEHLVVN